MMKIAKYILPVIAAGFVASSASAVITPNNTIVNGVPAGIVQNNWTIDTDTDFLSAVVLVELTSGATHDPFFAGGVTLDGDSIFVSVGDSFVTANSNTGTIPAGGAGDLLAFASGVVPGVVTLDPQFIGISWGSPGADTDDFGLGLPMGRFSFTDDAQGTWALLFLNEGGDRLIINGDVVNGEMVVPEPASLALMGLGGLVALRRRR